MFVISRRLGAAFFVSAFIILALALTVLWFASPVKVQAQSDMCVPAENFVEALASQPAVEFVELLGQASSLQTLSGTMEHKRLSFLLAYIWMQKETLRRHLHSVHKAM